VTTAQLAKTQESPDRKDRPKNVLCFEPGRTYSRHCKRDFWSAYARWINAGFGARGGMSEMPAGKHGSGGNWERHRSLRKSIVCAYCQNPWTEFLSGQIIAGPFMHPKPKSRATE
jgi:hypothetical protein